MMSLMELSLISFRTNPHIAKYGPWPKIWTSPGGHLDICIHLGWLKENLNFKKIPKQFICTLRLEKHWSGQQFCSQQWLWSYLGAYLNCRSSIFIHCGKPTDLIWLYLRMRFKISLDDSDKQPHWSSREYH